MITRKDDKFKNLFYDSIASDANAAPPPLPEKNSMNTASFYEYNE